MKDLIGILMMFWIFTIKAQIINDFEGGDLSMDSLWTASNESGRGMDFVITDGELNSDGPSGSGTLFIATELAISSQPMELSWEFYVRYESPPSGSNYVKVFLLSDRVDLNDDPKGYYLQMGESGSNDGIDLYHTSSNIPLISDPMNGIAEGIDVHIQVFRSSIGEWTLKTHSSEPSDTTLLGTALDTRPISSGYFGFLVRHSSSRRQAFFFDEVAVKADQIPDLMAPDVLDIAVISEVEIRIIFNEPLLGDALKVSNFSLFPKVEVVQVLLLPEGSSVQLLTDTLMVGMTYALEIVEVLDTALNGFSTDEKLDFEAIIYKVPKFRDVQINELLTDPNPMSGMPNAEFVELWNTSHYYVAMEGWRLADDRAFSSEMPAFALAPNQYLILTKSSSQGLFEPFGATLGLSNFPNFNASSPDKVGLLNQSNELIDSLVYTQSPREGITLEQINPNLLCAGEANFSAAIDPLGGTPGFENSQVSYALDLLPPRLIDLHILNADTFFLTFDESVDAKIISQSLNVGPLTATVVGMNTQRQLTIQLSSALTSGQSYALSNLLIQDCAGNTTQVEATFYFDNLPPKLIGWDLYANDVLGLIFDEPLEAAPANFESNFWLSSFGPPQRAMRQDSALNKVYLNFGAPMEINRSYQLRTLGLADTLENQQIGDSISFVFEQSIEAIKVINESLIVIEFNKAPTPMTALNPQNYTIDPLGQPKEVFQSGSDPYSYRLIMDQVVRQNKAYDAIIRNMESKEGHLLPTPKISFNWDTQGPEVVAIDVVSEKTIHVHFSEMIDPGTAVNSNNYLVDNAFYPYQVILLDDTTVLLEFSESFISEQKLILEVNHIQDLSKNSMKLQYVGFFYDKTAPFLREVLPYRPSILSLWSSEKIIWEEQPIHLYDLTGAFIDSISIHGPDSLEIRLHYEALPNEVIDELYLSSWCDFWDNCRSIRRGITIDSLIISEVYAQNDSTLGLVFSMAVESTGVSIEDIFVDQKKPMDYRWINTHEVLLDLGNVMEAGRNYDIRVTLTDSVDRILLSAQYLHVHDLEKWEILDSVTLKLTFELPLETKSVPIVYLGLDEPVYSLVKNKRELWAIFQKSIPQNEYLPLGWIQLKDLYGQSRPDHQLKIIRDTEGPAIQSIQSQTGSIDLQFNEAISHHSMIQNAQFEISEGGIVEEVHLVQGALRLTHPQLIAGKTYQLIAQGVVDSLGNEMLRDSLFFEYCPPKIPAPGEIIITEIMFDPTPSNGLEEVEYVELYNASPYDFELSTLRLADSKTDHHLPVGGFSSGAYLTLASGPIGSDTSVYWFSEFPSLNNEGETLYLISIDGDTIDFVAYTPESYIDLGKKEGGYSIEKLELLDTCITWLWHASLADTGGTPGRRNSVNDLREDALPPHLIKQEKLSPNLLELTYDEAINTAVVKVIQKANNRELTVSSENDKLWIQLDSLPFGYHHEIIVKGIKGCWGNLTDPDTLVLPKGAMPIFGDIVITEIMYDPTPSQGLPEEEYIELFNTTELLIDLNEVELIYKGDSIRLSGEISVGSYLVLSPSAAAFELENIIETNFKSLDNKEGLLLLSKGSNLISRLSYTSDWHRLPTTSSGGLALESIDPHKFCDGGFNWSSSKDVSGGTPGRPNTIFGSRTDDQPPALVSVRATAIDSVFISFDETIMDPFQVQVQLIPDKKRDTLIYDVHRPAELILILSDTLFINESMSIQLFGVSDCYQNKDDLTSRFVLPQPVSNGLIINEILYDPVPGGVDFLELYNHTGGYMSLNGLRIGNGDEEVMLPVGTIIGPFAYILLTPDTLKHLLEFPQTPLNTLLEFALPSMPNEGGMLFLRRDTLIDVMNYEDGMHSSLLASTEGISLERLTPEMSGTLLGNWHSAASTSDFATPGYQNSQFRDSSMGSFVLRVAPKVFVPGSSTTAYASFGSIFYQMNLSGTYGNMMIYDHRGRLIKQLLQNSSLDRAGVVIWDGTDVDSQRVQVGSYLIVLETYGPQQSRQIHYQTIVVGFHP